MKFKLIGICTTVPDDVVINTSQTLIERLLMSASPPSSQPQQELILNLSTSPPKNSQSTLQPHPSAPPPRPPLNSHPVIEDRPPPPTSPTLEPASPLFRTATSLAQNRKSVRGMSASATEGNATSSGTQSSTNVSPQTGYCSEFYVFNPELAGKREVLYKVVVCFTFTKKGRRAEESFVRPPF